MKMFLGTFEYGQMRRVEGLSYVVFSYSFIALFRYVMVNMFFAILDKHFRREDKLRKELMDAEGEQAKQEVGLEKLFSWMQALKNGQKAGAAAGGDAAEAPEAVVTQPEGGATGSAIAIMDAKTKLEGYNAQASGVDNEEDVS